MAKRLLEESDVEDAFDIIAKLTVYAERKLPDNRARKVILARLEEDKAHYLHHLLGAKYPAFDLDQIEVVRVGNDYIPVADIEYKPYNHFPPDYIARMFFRRASDSGIPFFVVQFDLNQQYNSKWRWWVHEVTSIDNSNNRPIYKTLLENVGLKRLRKWHDKLRRDNGGN